MLIGRLKQNKQTIVNDIHFSSKVKALGTYFGTNKKEIENLNWSTKLESCQKLINSWKRRTLTFFGKITVLKSLFFPKLTYLLQSITTPKYVLSQINSMIFKFVWGNNQEKIKRKTLIGKKADGGLDVPDIETFSKTLKLKWLKLINSNDNANWKLIPKFFLNQYGKNLLVLKMNTDSFKSLPSVQYNLPEFYIEILKHFVELNNIMNRPPKSFHEIRSQIIWGNRFIKHRGKTLLFQSWIDSELIYINDLLNENGEIKVSVILDKLQNKHNWISELSKLTTSIPCTWKALLRSNQSKNTKIKIQKNSSFGNNIDINQHNNQSLKHIFIRQKFEKPYTHNYWENLFNYKINWNSTYFNIHKVLVDNKIKQLKIKMIHNIIPTNEKLFIWKQSNSPLCKHCNDVETMEHFFLKCSYVQRLWEQIQTVLRCCNIQKRISFQDIIIGYKVNFTEYNEINLFLSQVTYTIYKCYMMSERRTKLTNMMKILYYDMLTLDKYLDKSNTSNTIIKKIIKRLKLILETT
jgi:hypothetical protein